MPGTRAGGKKACRTNISKYGIDFYREIGRKGGQNGHTGGFASTKVGRDGLTGQQRAELAGSKGGQNGHTGGFASTKVGRDGLTGQQRAELAGSKGGKKSKRGPAKHHED